MGEQKECSFNSLQSLKVCSETLTETTQGLNVARAGTMSVSLIDVDTNNIICTINDLNIKQNIIDNQQLSFQGYCPGLIDGNKYRLAIQGQAKNYSSKNLNVNAYDTNVVLSLDNLPRVIATIDLLGNLTLKLSIYVGYWATGGTAVDVLFDSHIR